MVKDRMSFLKRGLTGCLGVLLLVETTGCTSWKPTSQYFPTSVAQHAGRKVQVTVADGQTIEADSARVDGTTLVLYHGLARDLVWDSGTSDWQTIVRQETTDTIALARVEVINFRKSNGLGTFLVVLGLTAATVAALGSLGMADWQSSWQ